jgi:hypothetical protein
MPALVATRIAASRIHRFLLFLPVLLALAACGSSGPQACDEGGTLFNDNFAEERECGWDLYNRSGAEVAIEEEALHLTTSQPGQLWWTNPGRNFDDVIINVDATPLEGPMDNAYGIICRFQSIENFYVFLISGDGYYAIGKYQSGNNQITYLNEEGEYVPSEAINQGDSLNKLRASCIGDELSLSVNGVPLATITDPTFVTGDVGLAASTFEPGTLTVAYDNVRVIAP